MYICIYVYIYIQCRSVCFGLRWSGNNYELEEAREQIAMLEVGQLWSNMLYSCDKILYYVEYYVTSFDYNVSYFYNVFMMGATNAMQR